MNTGLVLVAITVLIAFTFDFLNGFHDAANSIATVVSTRVLTPTVAVFWAAFFNFVAAFFLGTAVAKTIGKGMIDLSIVTQWVVLSGLLGAIIWDSHALIGGYAGAAMARASMLRGWSHAGEVILPSGWTKTLAFIVLSPIIGLVFGYSIQILVYWMMRRRPPQRVDKLFRRLQLLSAASYSLGHGGNDAQKTMGIVAGALFTGGYMSQADMLGNWGHFHWPIILLAHFAMGLGTYLGGWRIVHTMGSKITKLRPVGGFCAETAGALTLFGTALAGIPVSTTHTITGAIIGVGATQRLSAVRWGVARRIVWAWVLTIPASASMAALTFYFVRVFHRMA